MCLQTRPPAARSGYVHLASLHTGHLYVSVPVDTEASRMWANYKYHIVITQLLYMKSKNGFWPLLNHHNLNFQRTDLPLWGLYQESTTFLHIITLGITIMQPLMLLPNAIQSTWCLVTAKAKPLLFIFYNKLVFVSCISH